MDGALNLGAVAGTWKRCLRSSHSPSLSKTKLKRPIAGYVWPHSPILIVSSFIAGDPFTRIKRAFVESKVKHFCWEWNLSFGPPPFRGHKIWSCRNVHIIFVLVTSIEGTPLFRGKGHLFWATKPGFNFQSGDTLAIKKWFSLSVD